MEPEDEEKEDGRRTDDLAARVQKLEEQVRGMHRKMWEAIRFAEATTEEENVSWRHDAGGEWQRWKCAWWVKVGHQNLNSRQRRQIPRGLWRLTAREANEVARLLRELQSEIKAEVAALRSGSQTDGETEKTGGGHDDDETWPRGGSNLSKVRELRGDSGQY